MSKDTDRPTVIQTGGSGSAGWAVAVIVLILVIAGGYFVFAGSGRDINVNVETTQPAGSQGSESQPASPGSSQPAQ